MICWHWTGTAHDEGEDAATWLTTFLGSPHRLMRYLGNPAEVADLPKADARRRPCSPRFAPGSEIAFADRFPVLLMTEVRCWLRGWMAVRL